MRRVFIGLLALLCGSGALAQQALGPADGLTTPSGGPLQTGDDYPEAAMRKGEEGTSVVAFTIGTDGRAADCTVAVSSGFDDLDARSCALVLRRARFAPPATAQRRTFTFRWRLQQSQG